MAGRVGPVQVRRRAGNGRIWRRKQKGGAVYVADWTDANGKRRRKAMSSDKRVAQRMLADIIRTRDLCVAGLGIEEGLDLSFAELMEEFLADLRARRSEQYVVRARGILNRLVRSMRVRTIRDLNPRAFLLFRRARLAEGIANRTANMDLTVVRTVLNWGVQVGYIAFNPLQGVQQLPTGRAYEVRPRRSLTDDEVDRLLAASMRLDHESLDRALATRTVSAGTKGSLYESRGRIRTVPQTAMWQTLIETGARFGELAQATWGDLSEERRTLTLRAKTTKSRKERVVPLREDLIQVLTELRVVHHEVRGRIPAAGDLIFLTQKGRPWIDNRHNALRHLRRVLDAAGIPCIDERGEKVDVHSLRHTAASRWARNGVGLAQAQKLLGHSDPKLTASIYTHLDAEDLRSAVESLPPLHVAQQAP